jgi:hypothetical protein
MDRGFLGYNATFMLDVVVCALLGVVPTLVYSLYLVKFRRDYALHRNIQVFLGLLLLVTVGLFELDMRWHGGIEQILTYRATPLTVEQHALFKTILWIHLFFAVSTVVLWAVTLGLALKWMPNPPVPCPHSPAHKVLGWLSAVDITLTSVTGLLVYYYGFVV